MASKTYRVKSDLVEKIIQRQIDYIVKNKESIDEAEIVNALIFKGLDELKDSDIQKYLELVELKKIK